MKYSRGFMAFLWVMALTQCRDIYHAHNYSELIWHFLINVSFGVVFAVSWSHVKFPVLVDVLNCGLNFLMMFGACWLRKVQNKNDKITVLPPRFLTAQLVGLFAMTLQMTSNYLVGSVGATIAF